VAGMTHGGAVEIGSAVVDVSRSRFMKASLRNRAAPAWPADGKWRRARRRCGAGKPVGEEADAVDYSPGPFGRGLVPPCRWVARR